MNEPDEDATNSFDFEEDHLPDLPTVDLLRLIVPRKSGLVLDAPKEKLITSSHKFSKLPKAKSKKRVAAGRVGTGVSVMEFLLCYAVFFYYHSLLRTSERSERVRPFFQRRAGVRKKPEINPKINTMRVAFFKSSTFLQLFERFERSTDKLTKLTLHLRICF